MLEVGLRFANRGIMLDGLHKAQTEDKAPSMPSKVINLPAVISTPGAGTG